jgi:hypothetical protein
VTDLAVAHLPRRQTDVRPARANESVRVAGEERAPNGRLRELDRIRVALGALAETVQDHEHEWPRSFHRPDDSASPRCYALEVAEADEKTRADARRSRAVLRRTRLGQEVDLDPIAGPEALSLVARLTEESWSEGGLARPTYNRNSIPVRFARGVRG